MTGQLDIKLSNFSLVRITRLRHHCIVIRDYLRFSQHVGQHGPRVPGAPPSAEPPPGPIQITLLDAILRLLF